MSFEDLKVRLSMLLDAATEEAHDRHELQERLREQLAEMRALGQPVPQDLVDLERALRETLEMPGS